MDFVFKSVKKSEIVWQSRLILGWNFDYVGWSQTFHVCALWSLRIIASAKEKINKHKVEELADWLKWIVSKHEEIPVLPEQPWEKAQGNKETKVCPAEAQEYYALGKAHSEM